MPKFAIMSITKDMFCPAGVFSLQEISKFAFATAPGKMFPKACGSLVFIVMNGLGDDNSPKAS